MGTARQAAEQVTTALEARDYDRVRQWLADDFTFVPSAPQPAMNADQWLAMNASTHNAFEDFSFNFNILREEGNQVWVDTHMEGTHTGDWDLSAMGAGVMPASGKRVEAGSSVTRGVVNASGKVERIEVVEEEPDGGLKGILQQLGVQMG